MANIVRNVAVLMAVLLAGVAPARGQEATPSPVVTPSDTVSGEDPAKPDNWRNAQRCGINAAYVFLKLQGVEADYDRLLRRIGVGERGSTLKDLRDAAAEAGQPAVVARTTLEGLARAPMPVVAHMERQDSAEFSRDRRGHYVVVLSVDDRVVRYVDGTTGSLATVPRLDFAREWTGYVLAADARPSGGWARPGWGAVAAAGMFSTVAWGGLVLSRRAARARRAVAALALVAVAMSARPASAGDPPRARSVPSVAEVRAEIEAQHARTTALWVTFATKQTALDSPATLSKYLNKVYLRDDRSQDAFKGPKRFHKLNQPPSIDPIAPPAPPRVDPDAPPAVREQQQRIREEFEKGEAKATKAAVPAGSRKLSVQPDEAWAYNGNGLDLSRLVVGFAEVHDYRKTGSMRAFQSEYLRSTGWEPEDPTFPKAGKEVRAAMTLPGAFGVFRYEARPALEAVEDGSACVVLSGPGTLAGVKIRGTIWLDVDHGLMLRRQEMALASDGTMGQRVVADDPRPVPGAPGIFLPGRCRYFEFAPDYAPGPLKGKALAQTEITLLDCKANDLVPDSLFELAAPPGTYVNDYRMGAEAGLKPGHPVEFVIPADAAELDTVIDRARRDASTRYAQSDRGRRIVLLNLAAVAALALVVVGRRFLRRKPRPIEGTNP